MKAINKVARTVLLAGLFITSSGAYDDVKAQVAVLVNDQAITRMDIAQRARLLQIFTRRPASAALTKEATEELIDEKLQLSEARKKGVVVSDTLIDQTFADLAGRNKMSPAQLSTALSRMGASPKHFKERMRAQLAWRDVVQSKTRSSAQVSEQDITALLTKKGDNKKSKTYDVSLTQIVFVTPKGSSAGYRSQRRVEANAFRARFKGCEQAVEMAKGLRDVAVKPVGTRNTGDMAPPLKAKIESTPEGKITEPSEIDTGYELVAICSKKEVFDNRAAKRDAQNELMNEQMQVQSRQLIRDLRSSAVIDYRNK